MMVVGRQVGVGFEYANRFPSSKVASVCVIDARHTQVGQPALAYSKVVAGASDGKVFLCDSHGCRAEGHVIS